MDNIKFKKGQLVKFHENQSEKSGEVQARFIQNTELEIDGKTITHKATSENPAYLIKMSESSHTILPESELKAFA
ncbi:HVA1 family protein [Cryomorpha ignava]|uniref:HVA1 family protein n=1 Tax=Cryomorpha ignava TaxID=101383 RepID=A0A7K3WWK6_9FLAO|nr:HVA1 family protein [Cryomorpha ignava]NEN24995.1 HVA1 family protein [Cryomorpha ignava]